MVNRFRIRNRKLFPFSSRRDLLRVDYIKVHTPRPISVYVDLSLADLAVVIAITHLVEGPGVAILGISAAAAV